jgi:hypothetical protein
MLKKKRYPHPSAPARPIGAETELPRTKFDTNAYSIPIDGRSPSNATAAQRDDLLGHHGRRSGEAG